MKLPNNISQEELERIEGYLTGSLTADEQQSFEQQLQTDDLLQQKTTDLRLTMVGISESFLQEKLNQFHPAAQQAPVRRMNNIGRRLMIAASILLVVLASSYFLFFSKNSNEKLYAAYYTADPGLPGNMGGATNYSFDKAMLDYKNGQYTKALDAWRNLPANDTITYFMGVAQMAKSNHAAAIELLKQSTAKSSNPFYKDACWYLGLAYLKQGDRNSAIQYIEQSNNPGKADLLKALNEKQ